MVAKPLGAVEQYPPESIIKYGKDAIIPIPSITTKKDEAFESARIAYCCLRDKLLHLFNGHWMGVTDDGCTIIFAETERQVVDQMYDIMKTKNGRNILNAYINCLGREILPVIDIADVEQDVNDH